MRRSFAVSLLAAVLLIGAPVRADDGRNAIEAANAKIVTDYAAGNAKALALAYTEDAAMLPPDATRVVGHTAIEALWKSWIDAGIRNLTLKSTDLEISGDLAYEVGELALQMPVKGGNPSSATGTYLFVWKRGGDGVWRVKVDTWNGPVTTEAKSASGG
jgi:ketosteroid isomerase-like protein